MKKLVFIAMAMVAISFTSCGVATNQSVDTDSTAVDTVQVDTLVDSLAVDSTVCLD